MKTKARVSFRAAFEGHHRLLLGEFRGSEHADDHLFQRKLSAVYTEQLNRQKLSAAAFAGKTEPVLGAGTCLALPEGFSCLLSSCLAEQLHSKAEHPRDCSNQAQPGSGHRQTTKLLFVMVHLSVDLVLLCCFPNH